MLESTPTRRLRHGDLLQPFEGSYRPAEQWTIGTESERFGVNEHTGMPLRYHGPGGVMEVFEILEERFGWTARTEVPGGPVIQLDRGPVSITLEPGSQVELSGATRPDLHGVEEETRLHLSELGRLSENIGLTWMGIGFHPLASQDELDWVPKLRYPVMREYLASRGGRALDMMRRTGTVQANFDYSDAQDAMRKLRVALRLSAVVSAMFANAPFVEGHVFGGRSQRMLVWFDVDPDRQGLLPRLWDPRSTVEDYVEWALDVPMFLIKRPRGAVINTGQTFRSYLQDGFDGERATLEDWNTHLNTLFPEVRLKRTVEVRGADSQSFEVMCALPALWTGILYDSEATERAESLTADWTFAEMENLRAEAAMGGLTVPFRGERLARTAEKVFRIARDGLQRRRRYHPETGRDETAYLDQIASEIERGRCPADRLLEGLTGKHGIREEILRRVRP